MKISSSFRRLLAVLALLLPALAGQGQTAQEPFGRVRIQYKQFDWEQFSTQNFDVLYYGGGEASARRAAEYAEKELQRITALIGYYPYSKTTLMLYNSVDDLRQSNIGLGDDTQLTGGETPLAKMSKVQIAFDGQQTDFKRKLSTQITTVLLNDMMYGGSLKEVLQSSYLLQLPNWFIGGVSAYAAEGWSVEMDGYMRDMVRAHPDGNRTAPFFLRDPELAGQSIWNYLAERHGYMTIQNVLNLTRITRDVEVGISSSINVPFRQFLGEWLTYYRDLNGRPTATLVLPDDKFQTGGRNRRNSTFSQPVLSPDGQHVAYAINEQGRYRVLVADRDGSHRRTISRGGHKTPDQQVATRLPVLSWRSNAQVAVTEMDHGVMTLHLRSARGRSLLTRMGEALRFGRPASLFESYEQVLGLNYSPDGKALVYSAVHDGQNDIFLLRAGSRRPEQLTNDLFDDAQPVLLPDGSAVVFSSNRYLDSTGVSRPASFPNVVNNYDLFVYHLDGRAKPIEPLVSTISNETRPRAISNDEILYLGEESGVRSIYRYSISQKTRTPVTNFVPNIQDFDYSPTTRALAFVASSQGRDLLYTYPEYELPASLTVPKTTRQQTLEDRSVAAAAPRKAPAAKAPAAATQASPKPAKPRKANGQVNVSDYQFEEDEPAPAAKAQPATTASAAATTTAATAPLATPPLSVSGPYRYDTRFMIDNVSTALYLDPLLGLGLQFRARLTDALENHRIDAGLFGLFDLRTSNITASYTNLTRRYDWSIAYQKQSYYLNYEPNVARFGRHEVAPTIAYPLTYNLSVRGGPRYVNLSRTVASNLSTSSDMTQNYLGFQGELVFDNAIYTGVNMMRGTRMKIGLLQLQSFDNEKYNFGKITIDLRHYQKVSRTIIWANRASYGQFLGPNPQYFRLGGMDNWLNASHAEDRLKYSTSEQDVSQTFYQQFITNMRGFDYSARTGSRYLLFNSELRVPIVQYFARRPIYSGFFRNLQLTGFVDAGTAYTGSNPFSENNSYNTERKEPAGSPFSATVINFRNPFLVGYGVGARTTVLGFYLKGDLAWGQEDYVTTGPKFYLSLGYDF